MDNVNEKCKVCRLTLKEMKGFPCFDKQCGLGLNQPVPDKTAQNQPRNQVVTDQRV